MKNFFFRLTIFVIYLAVTTNCCAQTNETSINNLYIEYSKLINSHENQDVAIDRAIEILKKSPESIEAYCTLTMLRDIEVNDKLRQKFNDLMNQYFSSLNDINSNTAEKIILIRLILMGFYKFKSHEDSQEKDKICDETLIKIKNECINKNYSALALGILFLSKFKGDECRKEFIKSYPNNPAVPYIKLELSVGNCWVNDEPEKGLDEAQKFLKKYPNIITPEGSRLELDVYSYIVSFYVKLKDSENALKYYNLIKTECPTHPDLPDLETEINKIN